MYEWRKMTTEQRQHVLQLRKQNHHPWHSPPHRVGKTDYYHISAACYEHKPIIGTSPERMAEFGENILKIMKELNVDVYAWSILPNHYHLLIKSNDLLYLLKQLGKHPGRTSYKWNGDENARGCKVWCNALDRYIRNEQHFWATMNYIHHNPVHHNYVKNWYDWPFSSSIGFLNNVGKEKAAEIWKKYPVLDYGKGWDAPDC